MIKISNLSGILAIIILDQTKDLPKKIKGESNGQDM